MSSDVSPTPEFLVFSSPDGLNRLKKGFGLSRLSETVTDGPVLRLADRLLATLSSEIRERVRSSLDSKNPGHDAASLAAQALEPFLSGMCDLLPVTRNAEGRRSPNLFDHYRQLDLRSQAVLTGRQPSTDVEKAIEAAYKSRNDAAHVREPADASEHEARETIRNVLFTMLFAVDRHRRSLRDALAGLVLRSAPPKDAALLQKIAAERDDHLSRFKGRDALLQTILEAVDARREAGGYVLLRGPEGIGKSALVGRLSERLRVAVRHAAAGGSPRDDPWRWVPGVIVHFTKQDPRPRSISVSIISQANMLLLEPLLIPAAPQGSAWHQAIAPEFVPSNDGRITLRFATAQRQDESLAIRDAIFCALRALVDERGSAVVLLDALDELESTSESLEFLPPTPPPGVAIVLTARAGAMADSAVYRFRPTVLDIDGLTVEDIAQQMQGEADAPPAERLRGWCDGNPYQLKCILEEARRTGGFPPNGAPPPTLEDHFQSQRRRWRTPDRRGMTDPRWQSLLLLSTLVRCGTVPLALLQAFLSARGVDLSLEEIRETLEPVSAQLSGLRGTRIALTSRPFAEHVFSNGLSPMESEALVGTVAATLATFDDHGDPEPAVDPALREAFMWRWVAPEASATPRQRQAAERLFSTLLERREIAAIGRLVQPFRERRDASALGLQARLLNLAAEAGWESAVAGRAERRIDTGPPFGDAQQGWADLRFGAEQGRPWCLRALGSRLVFGRGVDQDAERGLDLLERGVAGIRAGEDDCDRDDEAEAQLTLAIARARFGRTPSERTVGCADLERFAAEPGQHPTAALSLGFNLLNGDADERARALALLEPHADREPAAALGVALLGLVHGVGDTARACERLEWAADRYAAFRYILGVMLVEGRFVEKDVDRGFRLLRAAAETDAEAMATLGAMLFFAASTEANRAEGLALLEQAAVQGNPQGMAHLGFILLAALAGAPDPERGRSLIEQSASRRDPVGLFNLAVAKWRGLVPCDAPAEVRALLEEAIARNHPVALQMLADLIGRGFLEARAPDEEARLRERAAPSLKGVELRLLHTPEMNEAPDVPSAPTKYTALFRVLIQAHPDALTVTEIRKRLPAALPPRTLTKLLKVGALTGCVECANEGRTKRYRWRYPPVDS